MASKWTRIWWTFSNMRQGMEKELTWYQAYRFLFFISFQPVEFLVRGEGQKMFFWLDSSSYFSSHCTNLYNFIMEKAPFINMLVQNVRIFVENISSIMKPALYEQFCCSYLPTMVAGSCICTKRNKIMLLYVVTCTANIDSHSKKAWIFHSLLEIRNIHFSWNKFHAHSHYHYQTRMYQLLWRSTTTYYPYNNIHGFTIPFSFLIHTDWDRFSHSFFLVSLFQTHNPPKV